MNSPPETYLTVRQHADGLAKERHAKDLWRKHRNEPLNELFPAIWNDDFGDETTPCLLFNSDDVSDHRRGIRRRPEQQSVRRILWGALPKGEYWIPDPIRKAREGEFLWEEITQLIWDDYKNSWRREIIEQVVIPGAAFEKWKAQHLRAVRRRGREKGAGSLAAADAPLVRRMVLLIDAGLANTKHDAALQVVHKAAGGGQLESKVKRLTARYDEHENQN